MGVNVITNIAQQGTVTADIYLGITELVYVGRQYLATQLGRHGLHAVTNAEHGYAKFKDQVISPRCLALGD